MAKRQTSAADLIAQLSGIGEDIQKATVSEVRTYLGQQLADMAKGTPRADEEILSCLREADVAFEVSDDFRAGLAFAAELVTDPHFDY